MFSTLIQPQQRQQEGSSGAEQQSWAATVSLAGLQMHSPSETLGGLPTAGCFSRLDMESLRLLSQAALQLVKFGPVVNARVSYHSLAALPQGLVAAGAACSATTVDNDDALGEESRSVATQQDGTCLVSSTVPAVQHSDQAQLGSVQATQDS